MTAVQNATFTFPFNSSTTTPPFHHHSPFQYLPFHHLPLDHPYPHPSLLGASLSSSSSRYRGRKSAAAPTDPNISVDGWQSSYSSSSDFRSLFSDLDTSVSSLPRRTPRMRHHRSTAGSGARARSNSAARKNRRSLNIPNQGKPRVARLYARPGRGGSRRRGEPGGPKDSQRRRTGSHSVLEIRPNGKVRTSTNSSSVYSILKILLLCSVAPTMFRPCPVVPMDGQHEVYSSVLLYFNQTNRYLCVSSNGSIYSRLKSEDAATLRDCVFQNSMPTSSYDVFRSKNYPLSLSQCEQHRTLNSSSHGSKLCAKSWYLGVSKHGHVRVVKIDSTLNPTRRTFFIKRWIHENVGHKHPAAVPPSSLPGVTPSDRNSSLITTVPPREPQRKHSKSIFKILRGKSAKDRSSSSGGGLMSPRSDAERRNKGRGCSNLLSSYCGTSLTARRRETRRTVGLSVDDDWDTESRAGEGSGLQDADLLQN